MFLLSHQSFYRVIIATQLNYLSEKYSFHRMIFGKEIIKLGVILLCGILLKNLLWGGPAVLLICSYPHQDD